MLKRLIGLVDSYSLAHYNRYAPLAIVGVSPQGCSSAGLIYMLSIVLLVILYITLFLLPDLPVFIIRSLFISYNGFTIELVRFISDDL